MKQLARRIAVLAALVMLTADTGTAIATTSPYTIRTLHFDVVVGPGGTQHCDIVGDLYVPADASAAHRVPAILTTNGFGGSKDDQAGLAKAFASRDYLV